MEFKQRKDWFLARPQGEFQVQSQGSTYPRGGSVASGVRPGNIDLGLHYNLIRFLYTKQHHFAKVRELRVVLQCYDPVGGANRHYNVNNFPDREPLDELNPLHEWVHECKRRRIDLKALLTEVRLSPWATQEELEEIETWVKGKNFSCLVTQSDLTNAITATLEELRCLGA